MGTQGGRQSLARRSVHLLDAA